MRDGDAPHRGIAQEGRDEDARAASVDDELRPRSLQLGINDLYPQALGECMYVNVMYRLDSESAV
jgi:hypothetical protein